jgi:hypothetical protein
MLRIYDEYQKYGVAEYYRRFNASYTNPHEGKIAKIVERHVSHFVDSTDTILDIACGDGLISRLFPDNIVEGTDPFFPDVATFAFSFEDIAMQRLQKRYNVAICCYAFHLIDPAWKYDFLTGLALVTNKFIIITPSKKVVIKHPLWDIMSETRDMKITIMILQKAHNYNS